MAGVRKFKSFGSFAEHRSGSAGSGGNFLKNWKDKGSFKAWFLTTTLPLALWRHSIPQIVVTEEKSTRKKTAHVYSKNLVCHEGENVLTRQYFRERESEDRKHPPQRCGVCKLVEWCYQQCAAFEETRADAKPRGIRFTTPIFKFEGDIPEETQIVHIGGVCNLFNKDLNDDQKADMRDAKVSPREAWKENMWAKCQYALCVVNNDRPEDGVQIAVETSSLGDKIKKVLNDVLAEDNREMSTNPYVIEWLYNDKESDLNKKYDARPLRSIKPTPRILGLIRGNPPDLGMITEPFNQQTVRAQLERHCLLEKGIVPWDELFPTPEQEKKWRDEAVIDEEDESYQGEGTPDVETVPDTTTAAEDDLFACDECGKAMKAEDSKCPHCGHEYEVIGKEPEPPPEPEKPKMRTRAEVMKEREAKKSGASNGSAMAKGATTAASDEEIPF